MGSATCAGSNGLIRSTADAGDLRDAPETFSWRAGEHCRWLNATGQHPGRPLCTHHNLLCDAACVVTVPLAPCFFQTTPDASPVPELDCGCAVLGHDVRTD